MTFTSDTKEVDGFSAQRLHQEWTADEQPSTTEPEPELKSTTEQSSPSAAKPSKKNKKRAKQQQSVSPAEIEQLAQKGKRAAKPEAKETLEYVRYLQQYYSDKANWKFNKNKQKDLLKNLFNIYRIPAEHDGALVAYFAGLQGAAAQQRVVKDAEAVFQALLEEQERSDEVAGMATPAARKAAYEAALQREVEKVESFGRSEHDAQQLEEMRREVEKAKRADAVLTELLSKELAKPGEGVEATTVADKATHPTASGSTNGTVGISSITKLNSKRKRRKARTEVSSDESSSSSSESEGE